MEHAYVTHVSFFFSSRRRHTRCSRDWSSDVCSSDLFVAIPLHIDQSLIPPEGWNDSKRFRIGQRIQRCNSIRLRSLPRCREGVDEQVMRSIIPPHVYRQIKEIGRASCRERV